jgi:hypothetical protein
VTVAQTGDTAPHGGLIKLLPGAYTLTAALPGYRGGSRPITLTEGQPRTVQVALGEGFAAVEIQSEPPGAAVRIDDREQGQTPLAVELGQGQHRLSMSMDGFFDGDATIAVSPGVPQKIVLSLDPVPTSGPVAVKTEPGGAIIWKNRKVGEGSADLGRLPFKRYSVSGVKRLDAVTRLTGKVDFTVERADGLTVTLPLKQKERLFEGKWLPAGEALQREQQRYRSQRVPNPVHLTAVLDDATFETIVQQDGLAPGLHRLLRVGDRIRFTRGDRAWLIWKRNADPTPAFELAVDALKRKGALSLPWVKDPAGDVEVTLAKDPVSALAFTLHRARTELPVLSLSMQQLAVKGETFPRCPADGELTLLAEGGRAVSAAGIALAYWAGVAIVRLPAGDGEVAVTWQTPPEKLLVISDAPVKLETPAAGKTLQIREKEIVTLAEGTAVFELTRLSAGPDYPEGWSRKRFKPTGPLADQMDLSQDEIGPHDREGAYRRTWIIRYKTKEGAHQRQLECRYKVSGDPKDFSSDRFLRRDGLSRPASPEKQN